MKATLTTLLFALLASVSFAQAPQFLNYQAIARDPADGEPITTGQLSSVQFEILQGSTTGVQVYNETHTNVDLSPTGLFNLKIGGGTTGAGSGTFQNIPWASGPMYLKVTINGTITALPTQMLSVPYALYAASGVGAQGPPGATGPQGPPNRTSGATGANGCTRPNRTSGTTGANGRTRTSGSDGTARANGRNRCDRLTRVNGPYWSSRATRASGCDRTTGVDRSNWCNWCNRRTRTYGCNGTARANGRYRCTRTDWSCLHT